MANSCDQLVQEANVEISRDGDIVSFELHGTKYEMRSSEAERISTNLLAIDRHGENSESVTGY